MLTVQVHTFYGHVLSFKCEQVKYIGRSGEIAIMNYQMSDDTRAKLVHCISVIVDTAFVIKGNEVIDVVIG